MVAAVAHPVATPASSEVAAGLLRDGTHLEEVSCRPLRPGRPAGGRYSCSLPKAWARIDIQVTAGGEGFRVLPGSARDRRHARRRTPRFFGTFDVSDIVCAPRGNRSYLCDANYKNGVPGSRP